MTSLTEEALDYHGQLTAEAVQWHKDRGLSDRTIRHFKLGWIEEPRSPEAKRLRSNPCIPYLTTTGKVIELRVRKRSGKPKYLPVRRDYPLPAPKFHLFNAMQAMPTSNSDLVYVVEGEYDAMIAWQAGLKAVAVPGATQWFPSWSWLFEAARVRVVFDGDAAGCEGAEKLYADLRDKRIDCETVKLPDGMDVTDVWLAGGRSAVREALHS